MWCLRCEYDLRELSEGVCPECGRGFDPGDPATFSAKPYRRGVLPVLALCLASAPVVMAAALHLARVVWRVEHGHWPVPYDDDPKGEAWVGLVHLVLMVGGLACFVAVPVVPGCVVGKRGLRGVWLGLWCAVLAGGGVWVLWMDFFRVSVWIFD